MSNSFDADGLGSNLLHWIRENKLERLRDRLQSGLSPDTRVDGESLVSFAASWGRVECLRLLLDHGANPNGMGVWAQTPAHFAARSALDPEARCIRLLAERGAALDLNDNQGESPLHWAARFGDERSIKLLVGQGARVNAQSADGMTPAMLAALSDKLENLIALAEAGADLSIRCRQGASAASIAQRQGSGACSHFIQSQIDRADLDEQTPAASARKGRPSL